MSEPTEFKHPEWGKPLANEENSHVIEHPKKRMEEISDEQLKKNRLGPEHELSQLEQSPAKVRIVDLEAAEGLLLERFCYVDGLSKMRKDFRCLNCGRPAESCSEEPSLCANCQQIPNLFLG